MRNAIYSFSGEELVAAYNGIKERLFARLEEDGIIPSAENASLIYIVEVIERGRFGEWWDRAFHIAQGQPRTRILKIDHGAEMLWDSPSPKAP